MGLAWMSLAGALIMPPAEMREVEQRLLDKKVNAKGSAVVTGKSSGVADGRTTAPMNP
jgi:hypothetical protein